MECLNCKTRVAQTAGKRPKLYCSETCRVAFFRQKKAGEGVKKGKGRPRKHIIVHPKKVYDASKLPDYTMDEAGKYAVGVDPHSKEPSKAKTVVYSKKKGLKGNIPILATNPLPEAEIIAMEETVQNYKSAIILRSFRDYIDLIKTGKYDVDILRKEVQDDKKLLPAQKSMIYAKLK